MDRLLELQNFNTFRICWYAAHKFLRNIKSKVRLELSSSLSLKSKMDVALGYMFYFNRNPGSASSTNSFLILHENCGILTLKVS